MWEGVGFLNPRERLYLTLSALLIGAVAIGFAATALSLVSLERLRTSLEMVHGDLRFVLLAAFLGLLAAVMMFFSLRRGTGVETLLQSGPLGEIRISFKTIENLVLKAVREIKGVRETKTRIVASQAGLVIFLRAVAYPDQNIPQLAAELQAAVKEYVEGTAGSHVAEVKVMIENVAVDATKLAR
ncbi:MAG: alkaline shock response membrane anchor protein AmaP [Firmicutes bacterium]|nr:alkaline shock response membrane anchor protein AmaP [Bacillota bacterium]